MTSFPIGQTDPFSRSIAPADPAARDAGAVKQLEQMFLEEMLKYCGPGPLSGSFSGGAGEEQFASFLTREHAAILSQRVDLGFGSVFGRGAQT
ncbi:MAG: chemotaxis protein chel [Paracoccus sp. (in: a-proteobacteria)]